MHRMTQHPPIVIGGVEAHAEAITSRRWISEACC